MNKLIKEKINIVFLTDSFIYFVTSGLSRILLFVLVPIYIKYLGVIGFGNLDIYQTSINLFAIVFALGLPQVMQIEFLDFEANRENINKVFSTHLLLSIFISVLIIIPILLFFKLLPTVENWFSYLLITSIVVFQSCLLFYQTSLVNILKINNLSKFYLKLIVFQSLFQFVLSYIALVYFSEKIIYILLINLMSSFFVVYFSLNKIRIKFNLFCYDFFYLYDKIKIGIPIIGSYIAYWIINGFDKWIVLYYLGASSQGVYSISTRIASILEPMLIVPVITAYLPLSFSKYSQSIYDEKLKKPLIYSFFIFFIICLLLPRVATFFLPVSTPLKVYELMPFFVMGYFFYFLAQILGNPLVYNKKFKSLFIIIMLASIANILLNLIFIQYFGLKGSSYAFLISNFIWFLLVLKARIDFLKLVKLF